MPLHNLPGGSDSIKSINVFIKSRRIGDGLGMGGVEKGGILGKAAIDMVSE